MLKKIQRIKHEKDFSLLQKKGRVFRLGPITMRCLSVVDKKDVVMGQSKVGVVVGLKMSSLAVVRNQVKRRIRSVARELLDKKNIPPNVLISFYAFRGAEVLKLTDLRGIMNTLVENLKKTHRTV